MGCLREEHSCGRALSFASVGPGGLLQYLYVVFFFQRCRFIFLFSSHFKFEEREKQPNVCCAGNPMVFNKLFNKRTAAWVFVQQSFSCMSYPLSEQSILVRSEKPINRSSRMMLCVYAGARLTPLILPDASVLACTPVRACVCEPHSHPTMPYLKTGCHTEWIGDAWCDRKYYCLPRVFSTHQYTHNMYFVNLFLQLVSDRQLRSGQYTQQRRGYDFNDVNTSPQFLGHGG